MSPTVLLFIKTCALDLSEFNYSGNSEIRTFKLTYSRKIQEIKKQQHISVCTELILKSLFSPPWKESFWEVGNNVHLKHVFVKPVYQNKISMSFWIQRSVLCIDLPKQRADLCVISRLLHINFSLIQKS